MNKKIISALKYTAVFLLGFLTNFSGFLDNITSIPNSYKEFKKVYFYNTDLYKGRWSNNTEYLLGGGELGLDFAQPLITMELEVNEFGEINGGILSKRACDAMPLTWAISIESPEPGLSSIVFDRRFYIKQLNDDKMQVVAELKVSSVDERKNVITLERVEDRWNIFPEVVKLAKNLPAYERDTNELSDYCVGSFQRLKDKISQSDVSS
ncbi:hypothetical protein CYQ91_23540 [Vibrio diabolicus]|uniref:Uncharacterized protein n=1 Tax=Vibrio diabolicus TaxID=50719 RepID=A0AAX1XGP4_9VIBR|nr:hypothetical protein [Vibrio diabolicus]RPB32590.1 hypothetical protein CYQ91_23540 [Vibrio diabolicus]